MIPIIKDAIYAIDIEVKPNEKFDKNKYITKNEDNDSAENDILIESPNFYPWSSEIYGMSLSWGPNIDNNSIYVEKKDIEEVIKFISKNKLKLAAHNVLFDWLNLHYHFNLPLNFVVDTGVIAQCVNNSDFITSFGLKQFTQRMYNIETQDFEIKNYLRETYRIPYSRYGEFIHLCPPELIEKYCKYDSHYCWRIVYDCKKWLKSNIQLYMKIFISEVKLTIAQFIEGIDINKEGFEEEKRLLTEQLHQTEINFFNHPDLSIYIKQVQLNKFNRKKNSYKNKVLDFEEWSNNPKNKFNINSTTQLKELFDLQKLHWDEEKQKFIYPYVNKIRKGSRYDNPNSPKLGTKFLHLYGIGGEILADKSEKSTLLSHINKALDGSKYDGKIHSHINLLGTKSGRISGSGINIIATPISEAAYGKNLIVDKNHSILSADFSALEPTLLASLSNDPVLKYATFEGEGKTPFIKDGVLWIDDNYIMAAYGAPFMRSEIENKLDLDNWTKDPTAEKNKLKNLRNLSKAIVLSTNYGAGPLKVQSKIREDLKLTIPLKNVEQFQESYWATLSTAHQYKRRIENEAYEKGYLINIGGFPLTFFDRLGGIVKGTHKALNRMLQSSANICMKLLLHYIYLKINKRDDIIPLVCDWHDATWLKVKKDSVEEAKIILDDSLNDLNNTLKLPLKLRLNYSVGGNFYEAK